MDRWFSNILKTSRQQPRYYIKICIFKMWKHNSTSTCFPLVLAGTCHLEMHNVPVKSHTRPTCTFINVGKLTPDTRSTDTSSINTDSQTCAGAQSIMMWLYRRSRVSSWTLKSHEKEGAVLLIQGNRISVQHAQWPHVEIKSLIQLNYGSSHSVFHASKPWQVFI